MLRAYLNDLTGVAHLLAQHPEAGQPLPPRRVDLSP